jgi:CDP-glucose 4,6-dehydratase
MTAPLDDPAFWSGKRVLLTGHTGFKGAWLSLALGQMNAQVLGYALQPPTTPSLFELARVWTQMDSVIGDIRDRARLRGVAAEFQPQIVLHLAAQALVRPGYDQPAETFETNVMGTVNVLDTCRAAGCRVALIVTSDKCYRNLSGRAHGEDDPMGGLEPYSASKGCAELVVDAYRHAFFSQADSCRVASARAGNVIGGGDWATDRLVPDCIRALAAGEPIVIRNPDAVRPWQHVLEPLSGYLMLARGLWDDPNLAQGWNFGPREADAVTVGELVNTLTDIWGPHARWTPDTTAQPYESPMLRLDTAKARRMLGYAPRSDLSTALDWTVGWHRDHLAGKDPRETSLAQIDSFARRSTLSDTNALPSSA